MGVRGLGGASSDVLEEESGWRGQGPREVSGVRVRPGAEAQQVLPVYQSRAGVRVLRYAGMRGRGETEARARGI